MQNPGLINPTVSSLFFAAVLLVEATAEAGAESTHRIP
jgi:hypothetical protein